MRPRRSILKRPATQPACSRTEQRRPRSPSARRECGLAGQKAEAQTYECTAQDLITVYEVADFGMVGYVMEQNCPMILWQFREAWMGVVMGCIFTGNDIDYCYDGYQGGYESWFMNRIRSFGLGV